MHNIQRPIRYGLFRELDLDSQKEYLHFLVTRYNATAGAVANMFGISSNTICKILKETSCNDLFSRGRRMTMEQKQDWLRFLANETTEQTRQKEDDTDDEMTTVVAIHPAAMQSFCLTYTGDIDLASIARQLNGLINGGRVSRLAISCEL